MEIKRQARYKYSMHVFFKSFNLFIVFAALYLSSNSVSTGTKGGGLLIRKGTDLNKEGNEILARMCGYHYG